MFKKYSIGTISSRGHKMQGIYKITINNKSYIGKDFSIEKNKRFNAHLIMLFSGKHYNQYMQNYFNKYKKYSYEIIEIGIFSTEELSSLEKFHIEKEDTHNNGLNLTIGGEGGVGLKKSDELKKSISKRMSQSNNPSSKIDYDNFLLIVQMLIDGFSNFEIAEKFNINSGYVSLIRHKKRYSDWWDTVEYNPIGSCEGCSLSYNDFLDIIINTKIKNKEMATKYNIDRSVVSLIRNRKLYKDYYIRYDRVQRPTKSSDLMSEELSSVGPIVVDENP